MFCCLGWYVVLMYLDEGNYTGTQRMSGLQLLVLCWSFKETVEKCISEVNR